VPFLEPVLVSKTFFHEWGDEEILWKGRLGRKVKGDWGFYSTYSVVLSKYPALFFFDTKKGQLKFQYNLRKDFKLERVAQGLGILKPLLSYFEKEIKVKTETVAIEALIA
jgi:hypothetical protein